MVANQSLKNGVFQKMTENEKELILHHFNNTKTDYPKDKTLHQLFEEQAEKTPDHTAVVFGSQRMTYRELNEKSNQTARLLRDKGVGSGSTAAIMTGRSFEMIIGIMGVLKAGGTYLPIDPETPKDRIAYMLKDTEATVLLTKGDAACAMDCEAEVIHLDKEAFAGFSREPLRLANDSGDAAYIIYTSGSTGMPKGVVTPHYSAVRVVKNTNYIDIRHNDVILQLSNYSFDGSIFDIFGALLNGATLVMIEKETLLNISELGSVIKKEKVSVMFITTALFNTLADIDIDCLAQLRKILFGGERVSVPHAKKVLDRIGPDKLIHVYGPTESTVYATYYFINDIGEEAETIPIGRPLANTSALIMDEQGCLLPIGVPGELCISGDGLSTGYLNRKELTAEKFIPHPFIPGERLYKTGDLAKWLPDGNIEFIGRIDHQVKIRGFRIELGEIESQLEKHEDIKETIVTVREDGENRPYICAYMTSKREITVKELREFLGNKLPDYMIPAYFVKLDKLPLTKNGKVDRKALPEPDRTAGTETEYEAPRNDTEEKLAEIWCDILHVEKAGINDHFTMMGGHSLNAMELIAKIKEDMNVDIPLHLFFKLATIKELSAFIESNQEEFSDDNVVENTADPEHMHESFPLTGIQLAYLVGRDETFEIGGVATNLTVEFEADVDLNRFQTALQKLINRHPILRTIVFENGTQKILEEDLCYTIETLDVRHVTKQETEARILKQREKMTSKIIDPSVWPLFEIKTFILPEGKKYFFLNVDPLICDDSSMKILIREFKQFYENPSLQLPSLDYSFRDYVLASLEFKQTNRYKKDKQYWLDKLNNFPSAPELPLTYDPANVTKPTFKKFSTFLEQHTWTELKKKARTKNLTPTSVLCAAYAYILAYWSRQNHFAINLTVFNRMPFHPDVKNMVGDFTTLMLLDINAEDGMNSFWNFALNVQDTLLEALEHRHYDGVDVIRNIAKKNGMNKKAVMPIVFTSVLSENPEDSFDQLVDFDKIHFFSTRTSQVYIDNQVYEINGGLYITWDYVEQIFDHDVITSMFNQFIDVINQVVSCEEVSNIQIDEKSRKIIQDYNDTDQNFNTLPLHELFINQVKQGPDRIAVKHHEQSMTYRQLDETSNQVARYLIEKGVEKGDYIGVIGKRSIGTMINLLAVLKSGAAYIPLDPDYPEERKEYIKSKSNCRFFISHDIYEYENIERFSKEPVDQKVNLEDMAYVIFTSGSTGKPKGVQITHGAAANTILDINEKFGVSENDKIMGISSLCFDLSVYDVFGALSSGAALIIIDDQRDVFRLKETVEKEEITIWNSVPALMGMTADLYHDSEHNHHVRLVLLSGDWIPLQLPENIKKTFKKAEVISLGGATEGSIWSIYYPIRKIEDSWKSIPYGKPLANQKIYVLNQHKQLCPVGVEGELYIGGLGVASGYIHDKEKTDQSFIWHQELGYIYKTGDYGVLKEDGYVEFLGRKDSQVKIRGYRVELGEIENTLLSHADIRKATVIDHQNLDGIKNLYAFVVAEKEISQKDVKGFLQNTLPDYMIPVKFVNIDEIPLTVNGKIDKRKLHQLAEEQTGDEGTSGACIEPENETQAMLLEIWKDIFGLDSINLNVSYYEIGGDSLKAISMISEINKKMNVEMPIGEIFKNDTIIALDRYLKSRKDQHIENTIKKAAVKEYYPASPAQKRMYMLSMMENERGAYHIPMALLVEGRINPVQLENAFQKFLQRHEILRTGFDILDNELIQNIYDDVEFKMEYERLDDSIADQHALMEATSAYCKESTRPFDLSRPPLMRVKLITISEDRHILVINFHHIVADGVSQGILMNEILELYTGEPLPEAGVQYKDYVEWHHTFHQSAAMKKQEKFWLDVYRDIPARLDFPYDDKRENIETFEGSNIYLNIDQKLSEHIRDLAKNTGTTLYMVMLSAYYVLLNKYTDKTDIVVGTAAAGRLHQDLQDVFGVFVNTLALRNKLDTSKPFREFLNETKNHTIAAFEHSEYQFDDLIRKLNIKREPNRNPLFDTMFVLEDARMFTKQKGDVKLSPIIFELDNAKFDMTFNVLDFEQEIMLNIEYSTNLFKEATISRIAENYLGILREISANPDLALDQIGMMSRGERQMLLQEFNNTKVDYPKGKTIHQLFEEQAQRTPDQTAVVFEHQKLTYRQLNEKANRLAGLLREKGVRPDTLVGIMMERSTDMIAAMMGILKSGGAYLPIDPEYPLERIKYMMDDSRVKFILTDDPHRKGLEADTIEFIDIGDERIDDQDPFDIANVNQCGDLAYVIYTSGSTGKPKGVMVEHHSLANLCHWHQSRYDISENDNSSIYASVSFDAFVWELFPYITAGASVHVLNHETRLDVEKLNRYFHEHHISICFLPTQVCEQFIALDNHSLRILLTGGDKLNIYKEKNYQIVNNYGPTENTVVSTSFTIDKTYQNIPIGKPIDNVQAFILNQDNKLCPLGAVGELCIGGEGLARGYLHRPELTAEKFIPHPFTPGERMYRTGDLAKILPDGNIQFLGRVDQQVKIRGYRIEPGEIESRLLEHTDIDEAAVIAREDGDHDSYLCAYVAAKKEIKPEELRSFLKKDLPDYMVPAHFVKLDRLPLTVNGKLDKNRLPAPDRSGGMDISYEAPRDETEEKLASIWGEALGIENIGINHNFFEAGGHSLKAAALLSNIHKELKVKVPLRQIFETPTIKGLRESIASTRKSAYPSIAKAEEKPYYRLSSAQKRLFILNQIEGGGISYNMPFAMTIEGDFDIRRFENALKHMIQRHESFRTSFLMIDGEPVQKIEKELDFQVAYSEIGAEKPEDKIKDFIRPFHLQKAPLVRAEVLKMNENKHLMMFDMHHIISDGVSMDIFMKELSALYEGKTLPPLKLQYKDYSEWEKGIVQHHELKKQEAYWLNVFKGDIPVLNMPTDYKRPLTQSAEGDTVTLTIERETLAKLQNVAKENGVTMYMLLLAGYTALLSKYTGQEDVIVGTPVAGRRHEDIHHVIGMFVNTLAIRNHPEGNKTFRKYLNEVKENTLLAYENQDYQFEELVEKVNIQRDMSRNPLFDTMLVYHNTAVKPFEANGLRNKMVGIERGISKFDITVNASESANGLILEVEYCTALFKKERIERLAEHLINLLQKAAENPDIELNQIDVLKKAERNRILQGFNRTDGAFCKEKTIPQLFEEQAEKTPDHTAVVFADDKITYRELNERANHLASILREKGVGPDIVAGIITERSIEMIVGIMGILKAGGAYLPIDPEYPEERKRYMLKDSRAKAVCVSGDAHPGEDFNGEIIRLDQLHTKDHTTSMKHLINPQNLAYVIYTSGSTGKPKGVMIEHHSVNNLVQGLNERIYQHLNSHLHVALVAPYIFDASVKQIFASLLLGHTLYIVPREASFDAMSLIDFYEKNRINVSDMTPAHVNMLTYINKMERDLALDELIVGGDSLTPELVEGLFEKLPGLKCNITNVYGPTECCVDAASYQIEFGQPAPRPSIPIGRPLFNTQIYIVDKEHNPQPIGIAGEMCISGEGVARGYLNQPELTADQFVDHPFEPGKKMYKTGDLAMWHPDGNIEFLGRADHQVKIRGYRIELGEVENQLLRHEDIKEAAVLARKDQNQNRYLCAYITAEEDLTAEAVRQFLEKEIPDYMIPSYIVKLDELPYTSSGKIDRKALPEPGGNLSAGTELEPPRNEIERKLVQIWREILGAEDIGISHHFFASGGDSIKALQIVSRLARLNLKLEMRELFAHPKIKDLSKYIRKETKEQSHNEAVTGETELLPIQKRYFAKNKEEPDHFNQSFMLFRKDGFDENDVRKAFNKILEHHDALRMIYKEKDGEIIQLNRGYQDNLFGLDVHNIKGIEHQAERVHELAADIQKKSSIKDGKLVNLAIFQADEGDHLLIVIHHLVVDGVSWRIILEDFETLYTQAAKGERLDIGYKTDSYQAFARQLKAYAAGRKLLKEREYWRETAKAHAPFIPENKMLERDTFENSTTFSITLDKETTSALLRKTNRAYNTEINDILLTALLSGVRDMTGENKLKVMMEGHGREDILEGVDISRTVGWFTTVYPVFLNLGEEKELSRNIKMVKESLRKIPNKGIGYGVLKYLTRELDELNEVRAPISFNYFGEMNELNRNVFSQSPLPSGESVGGKVLRHCPIEMNAIVTNGELTIYTTFNQEQYHPSTIRQFNQTYKENLEKIIAHCAAKDIIEMTPSDYGDASLSLEELENIKNKYSSCHIEKIYPLANMQKGMLFHAMEDHTSGAYFQQIVFDLKGSVNAAILEDSFNEIVKRHEILRASFEYEIVEEPRQIIAAERKIAFTSIDLKEKSRAQKQMLIEKYLKEDQEKGFDLSSESLMRVCLIRIDDESYQLIWSHHHILLDGWCLGIMVSELFNIYGKRMTGDILQLEAPKPYSDYIKWLEKQDQDEAKEYWQTYLDGYETRIELPKRHHRKNTEEYCGEEKVIALSKDLTKKLTQIANQNNVTINTVLQGIWGIVLAKYNKAEEVVFGTVVSGREAKVDGIGGMLGLFINTIPTRIRFGGKSFKEVLKITQAESLESNRYSYMNLSELQELSELKRELISHVMVFQNYAFDRHLLNNIGDIGFELKSVHGKERTNYDFNMIGVLEEDRLTLKIAYDQNVYDQIMIDNIEKHVIAVAEQVAEHEEKTLSEIDLVSDEERNRLLYEFNNTKTDYPKDKTLHQLFEEQAEKTPDHTAIVFGSQRMTYRELNEKANQAARLLRDKGISAGSIAAIITERSFEMIIGIMGVLKAGGMYLPIDPETPKDRIDYILENSGAELVLTKEPLLENVAIETVDLCANDLQIQSVKNLRPVNRSSDTAYIVYTSGSTGTPKGVVIPHYSAVRVVKNTNYIDIRHDDVILQLSNYSFDGSIFDIFGALLNGATLVMIEKDTVLNISELAEVINKQQVSVMFITTALFNTLADIDIDCLAGLRKILFGGERVSMPHVKKVLDRIGPDKLIHVYGPTESTVYATYYFINDIDEEMETIPIGRPLANTSALIMDEQNRLLPIGVPGELCISGDGLSTGYLNRVELTAEKFIPHPFIPGERLYKTGDLAKWLPDGNIEFIGRIDHQVKIRGFRIELGEIESQLEKHDDINETIVTVREDGENRPYICAYMTSKRELTVEELREFLGNKLPDYMIPAYFVKLDKLPLTKNGKVDRKALPEPDRSAGAEREYEEPRNFVEKQILSILETVLGTERMGISCHFFERGGNSLKAMQAVHSINKAFGINMRISTFFQNPTVKSLAGFVFNGDAETAVMMEYAEEEI